MQQRRSGKVVFTNTASHCGVLQGCGCVVLIKTNQGVLVRGVQIVIG